MNYLHSRLKQELGGTISSKSLKKSREAKKKALMEKIEGKRKEINRSMEKI
jgi:hypothetical protein